MDVMNIILLPNRVPFPIRKQDTFDKTVAFILLTIVQPNISKCRSFLQCYTL